VKKVVFLGDFNVDLILDGLESDPLPDREIGCSSFDTTMGASSCLAAAAYARLGGGAWSCGLRGDDANGRLMVERLAAAGVRTDLLRVSAALSTGVTVNLVRGAARYQITCPGAMAAFSASDVADAVFDGLAHLHVSGVYQTRGLLPGVAGLLRRAVAAGATTSLDCQWDPDETWEGLREWLPAVGWLLVNAQEARSITGRADPREALRGLASMTPCPVVKAGADGAFALDAGAVIAAPAPRVTVVDTIGAGDNFDAGFLFARIEKGMGLAEALRAGVAAGSLACARRGGEAGSSWRDIISSMETHP
jgi:sugar/nucleoside kinase (ribokinase family)